MHCHSYCKDGLGAGPKITHFCLFRPCLAIQPPHTSQPLGSCRCSASTSQPQPRVRLVPLPFRGRRCQHNKARLDLISDALPNLAFHHTTILRQSFLLFHPVACHTQDTTDGCVALAPISGSENKSHCCASCRSRLPLICILHSSCLLCVLSLDFI